MRIAVATPPCQHVRQPRSRRVNAAAAALVSLLLAGCASEAPKYDPGPLDAERAAKCRAAELAYRSQAPEYAALRDELAADPIGVHWLVRMFVRDLIFVREGRPLAVAGDETEVIFKAAAGIEDPVERRAIAEIEALGAKAVPTIVADLLQHSQPQPRELGIELIARIGPTAVPGLLPLVRSGLARERRVAARALGAIGDDEVVHTEVVRLAQDADFTVRADAMRGLASGGERAAEALRAALVADPDAFVRRVAAQSLARHPGAKSARALVDYLARCQTEGDVKGEVAAQTSLQKVAGVRGTRTLANWRKWLDQQGR